MLAMPHQKQRLSGPILRRSSFGEPAINMQLGSQIITIWIAVFFLFSVYGPTFNLFGEFRYVEVVLIALTVPMLQTAWRFCDKITRNIIFLLLLTAIAQILSDTINDVYAESTIKRVGTYFIFIFIIMSWKLIAANNWTTIRIMLIAYSISWVFTYFVGSSAAPNYQFMPWRLGMGAAFTLAVCTLLTFFRTLNWLKILILAPVSLLHIILGSRSIALFTIIALIISLISNYRGSVIPRETTPVRFFGAITTIIAGLFTFYYGLIIATELRLFPEEVQQRTEAQVYSKYGLAATARPETASAVLAIAEKPLIGWGSTAYDPIIWRYYVDVLTENWASRTDYENIYRDTIYQDWDGGLPSHSHVLGAWTDGGIFASLSWFYILGWCIYLIIQCFGWKSSSVPLAVFVASTAIWDIAFSPGPHRMDMAMKLLVLTFLIGQLKHIRHVNSSSTILTSNITATDKTRVQQ
jgi:hypothetical protein